MTIPRLRGAHRRPPLALRLAAIASVGLLIACAPQGPSVEPAAQPVPTEPPVAAMESVAPVASPAGATPSATRQPTIEVRTVTETRRIPYKTRTVKDPALAAGTTKVRTRGVDGVKTLTYEVQFTDGVQTGRKLIRETVTRAPVTEVTAVGTKPARRCDPNYSGACVPIASDVDCAGGSGNGPAYVSGVVRVIGEDIYGLDRDGDGYGCD